MLDGLSVFFPCYNEESNIVFVLDSAIQILPDIAKQFEIIVVDDGSQDQTAALADAYSRRDSRVRLIRHDHNQGYGAALKTGFRSARLPWVFFTDADRQFDLSDLERLVPHTPSADIVAGYRLHRADPWYRLWNASLFALSLRIFMGLSAKDVNSAFKLYRRDIIQGLPLRTDGALINAEILCRADRQGRRIVWVGVSHWPRRAGTPSGAKPRVILKAMIEFWILFFDLRSIKPLAKNKY